MFQVAVARDFIAQHYLIGGDWGAENELHSHHYQIELILDGEELDQHGYLVDIVDIEAALDALIERYRDQTLNDLPDFAGVNPSIERFSRILCQSITTNIRTTHLNAITVRLWENQVAWASYRILVAAG